jgi:thiamine-monophosphate kinase
LTVQDAGERALIARIAALAGPPPDFLTIGIGDDAAVLDAPVREQVVLTCDAQVEGVHFRRDWTDAESIGRKAVAVSLSDLAAMGAAPHVILLSLCLPAALPIDDFDALTAGAVAEARGAGAVLAGGNITRSPGPLVLDVTAMGRIHRRRVMTRAGARAGDELWVTGTVGAAAAGLAWLEAGRDRHESPEAAACVARYERPAARVRLGRRVASSRSVTAAMDLSDGLADAARQIAEASGCGVALQAGAAPVDPAARAVVTALGSDPLEAALAGGEDYELLFAVPAKRRRAFLGAISRGGGPDATCVGRLSAERNQFELSDQGGKHPLPTGYQHLVSKRI